MNYAYDVKDQLTSETSQLGGGFTANFGYDAAGNPTTFKGVARTYDAQNRRTGTGFAYDVQGNPTLYQGTSISYTPDGGSTQIGSLLSADYTAEGVRAWKQPNGGSKTYFIYDGLTPVMELDATGAVSAVNTFGAAGLVSRRTYPGGVGTSVFYVFDERGNTSRRLDNTGAVLSSHAADAFGGVLNVPTASGLDDPYGGYGAQWGYYRDAETGLYLCTFRYYDPSEGRWLTADPIGFAGGVNVYSYCENHALSADPSGLKEWYEPSARGRAIIAWFGGAAKAVWDAGWKHVVRPLFVNVKMRPDAITFRRANPDSPSALALRRRGREIGELLDETGANVTNTLALGALQMAGGRTGCPGGRGPRPPWISPGSMAAEEEAAVTRTLQQMDSGATSSPWGGKWGELHANREGLLPGGTTYHEYYVPKAPGDVSPWGPRRIVKGLDGSIYYSANHYLPTPGGGVVWVRLR